MREGKAALQKTELAVKTKKECKGSKEVGERQAKGTRKSKLDNKERTFFLKHGSKEKERVKTRGKLKLLTSTSLHFPSQVFHSVAKSMLSV